MKTEKLLSIILFLFIAGCNQGKTDSKTHGHDTTAALMEEAEHHEVAALSLNEGKKWQLDDPSRKNMAAIRQVIQEAENQPQKDYALLADSLQVKTNTLVSECKMGGRDHDMLHVWLEKYLSTLKELKAPDAGKQEAAFREIKEQLENFDQFFE